MCGIAGVVGGDPGRERPLVERMSEVQRHRGPDDGGIARLDGAVLANRRLAVIDPGARSQPMESPDGRFVITYNGEIYNHRALRAELEGRGHAFRTRTDTEVLLRLFELEGWKALDRLHGMFAFAIWDRRERRLHAARDAFGQKPFHHAVVGERFIFASEIKGVLAHPDVGRDPDLESVDHYLTQRFVPAPRTMFRAVRKLPAGHRLEWKGGEVRVERWFEPRFGALEPRSDEAWIEGLRERVERAVERHLESDVPVGALLSGGLDSGVVVASMAARLGPGVPTFCVGTEVASLDERPWAAEVARHFGTRHREERVGDETLAAIPTLVRALDEPSDPIAACTWTAARLASSEVKVALGGDGGDEVFGGFDRYAAFVRVEQWAGLPGWVRRGVTGSLARLLPGAQRYKSLGQKARWLHGLDGLRGGALYARMTSIFRFGPDEKAWAWGEALAEAANGEAERLIEELFDQVPMGGEGVGAAEDRLNRMLRTDLLTRLPEHSLLLADRLSMTHGLELRSPLLDRELWDFAASMPARLRVRGSRTKVALREAFRGHLPDAVLARPKQGFMLPFGHWMQGSSLEAIRVRLEEGPLVREAWIAPGAASRLAAEHGAGGADHHVRLWMLLALDAWARELLGLGEDQGGLVEAGSARDGVEG